MTAPGVLVTVSVEYASRSGATGVGDPVAWAGTDAATSVGTGAGNREAGCT
jgi:hypothetical protein